LVVYDQRPTINDQRFPMSYADITRNDRNPVKRFLQRRRLSDALSLIKEPAQPRTIIDFGAGDGELCRILASRFPKARIFCYEPAPSLREDAVALLRDIPQVVIAAAVDALPQGAGDLVFCMEVFEHLPDQQTADALKAIHRLLSPEGTALVGVPVEVFAPAMLKGMFRMTRRRGDFDANVSNIVRAALGFPPRDRPVAEIMESAPYYYQHLGFDHRRLRRQLKERFRILRTVGSPVKAFPAWLNSEVYFLLQKAA
jgi:trans-aconitate methyltransferase